MVIESDLEEFSLEMEYVSLSPQPHDTFLDLKGKIKARFRFTRPGKDFWENTAGGRYPGYPINGQSLDRRGDRETGGRRLIRSL